MERNKEIVIENEKKDPHVYFCLIDNTFYLQRAMPHKEAATPQASQANSFMQPTLDTQTVDSQDTADLYPRLSVESVSSLVTQDISSQQSEKETTVSISREDIEKEENDLKEVFTAAEL